MPIGSSAQPESQPRQFGWRLAIVALFALRLPHLEGPIDDPHSWRQCDTIHYSLDFFRNGFHLLHPAVCWLGAHRTLIFEFPLPEAMSAVLYRLWGPDPLWDRVVALAFFAMAAAYLFAFVRRVAGERVAWLATLAYLAFPLAQFFSRAAQVDFAATAFAHALLYYAVVALERRSVSRAALAAGCGVLAAMIKAPYLLPVLGPLGVAALAAPTLATLGLGAIALGIPAIAFVLWRRHVDSVNAAAPDWNFLPGYYKEVNPLWWYIGNWAQRRDPANWIKVAHRVFYQILTPLGAVIAAIGLFRRDPNAPHRFGARAFAFTWTVGAFVYLSVFFPLNVIHNYYQIPFLAPCAMWVGIGLDLLWEKLPRFSRVPLGVCALAAFLVYAAWTVRPLGYYRIDWLRVEAGRAIQSRVPAGDLIVISDFDSGYSDPRLLLRADHAGWPLAMGDLDRDRLARLASLGARWVAAVTDPDHPKLSPPSWLEPGRVAIAPVEHQGKKLGTLRLYDLSRALAAAGTPR